MSFVVHLLVLLGVDVHSLVGHPLTKLKLTLIFFPLLGRESSELEYSLSLRLLTLLDPAYF